jgi:ribonucleoside-diphosphate reductase beta chain
MTNNGMQEAASRLTPDSPQPESLGPVRDGFASLSAGGLDWNSLPLRLYVKGNAGFWDPAEIDFTADQEDWARLSGPVREAFTSLGAMFLAGEEAVARDLQPFLSAMSAEGRFGDEMYLAQFCFEETRHVQVFRRWLDAVGVAEDLNTLLAGNSGYQAIFHEALPQALRRLTDDPSPANQVRASITYNHVVEGTLALTGYHGWVLFCKGFGIFPGMQQVIARIGDDERRHMAWGTYTCRRHVAADDANWSVARRQVFHLMPHAIKMIESSARQYPAEFSGFDAGELLQYATSRARRRLRAIASARGTSVGAAESDATPEQMEETFASEDSRQFASTLPVMVTGA